MVQLQTHLSEAKCGVQRVALWDSLEQQIQVVGAQLLQHGEGVALQHMQWRVLRGQQQGLALLLQPAMVLQF